MPTHPEPPAGFAFGGTCLQTDFPTIMTINRQTDETGEIQIGATDQGMVRVYVRGRVAGTAFDLPMDFTPDEAREIAAEILDAADAAADKGTGKG